MTKNAKVLYITYNGVGESIFQSQVLPYLKGLSEKGYDITLLSYERDGKASPAQEKTLNDANIKWHKLRYHKSPRVLATFYDFMLGAVASFSIALKHKINIIHARATHGAIIGFLTVKILRKKFIFDTRGLDSEEYVDGGMIKKNSLLHKIVFMLEKYLFSQSDSIVLLSHNARALLEEKGLGEYLKKTDTEVIPCVTDLDLFKYYGEKTVGQKNNIKFIYTGSIGTWYMLDEMLDFFKVAREKLTNATFDIFTQSNKSVIDEKIKKLNIDSFVKTGYVDHDSVPDRLRASDAGVCFIKAVSSKRASSPTKIGEYLACGLPVVINSGVGDIEGIIRDNGVGVVIEGFDKVHYEKALADLRALLEDKDISRRCRQAAERHFSLNDAINKYDIIYGNLTKS
ncbi:glycosyltransferase family 4 protein [Candidatus Omnitrophota bacterium]